MKLVGSTVTDTTVLAAPELARHGITASDVANGVGLSATTQAIDAVSDAKAAFDLAKNVVTRRSTSRMPDWPSSARWCTKDVSVLY